MKAARVSAALILILALSQDIDVWGQEPQAPSEKPQRPAVVAFVNVNVVPMDRERILPGQTVIVRADRISEIGPADTTDVPEGALRIDGRDKYLMPGLVDMHVHQLREERRYQLTLLIVNGITTIRNMCGEEQTLLLRERIEKGELVGPTIYTTGPGIHAYSPDVSVFYTIVDTAEEAVQAVAEHKEAGYDFIKLLGVSLECYDAIIEAAAEHGMPVVGHIPDTVGLEHALAAGHHCIEHLGGYMDVLEVEGSPLRPLWEYHLRWQQIDATKIPYIVEATREAGTWNCPTLTTKQKMVMGEQKPEYMKYIPPQIRQQWKPGPPLSGASRIMSNFKRLTKALHDGGARIVLGTDIGMRDVVAGFSLHEELRHVVDAGLTPYEAIKAGTRDAADCLGELDEFGTVSAGLRADLILVEDNPLEDVRNVARRAGVMVRGRWFPRSELQAMLDALVVKHATEENPDGVMLRGRWHYRGELERMVDWCKEKVDAQNKSQRAELLEAVLSSDRILLVGRDGPATRAAHFAATNLEQLGLKAYVAADATTPAIEKGDLIIVITRWGETTTRIYDAVSAAKKSGISVVLLTEQSPFRRVRVMDISDLVFVLGPDFREATWLFIHDLITAATVSLRPGTPAGKMTYDDVNDTYTIYGAGQEIWVAPDQLHFAYHTLHGDGSIVARIDSVQHIHDWTTAGVMIRDTTAADSANAAVLVTPQNRVRLQYRSEAGMNLGEINSDRDAISLPTWIKLIREGNTFKAQHSEDGKKWNDLEDTSSGIEIEMDDPVHVGLAVRSCSGPAIAAEAKISRVSFGGNWSSSGRITLSEDIGFEAWGKPGEAEK